MRNWLSFTGYSIQRRLNNWKRQFQIDLRQSFVCDIVITTFIPSGKSAVYSKTPKQTDAVSCYQWVDVAVLTTILIYLYVSFVNIYLLFSWYVCWTLNPDRKPDALKTPLNCVPLASIV